MQPEADADEAVRRSVLAHIGEKPDPVQARLVDPLFARLEHSAYACAVPDERREFDEDEEHDERGDARRREALRGERRRVVENRRIHGERKEKCAPSQELPQPAHEMPRAVRAIYSAERRANKGRQRSCKCRIFHVNIRRAALLRFCDVRAPDAARSAPGAPCARSRRASPASGGTRPRSSRRLRENPTPSHCEARGRHRPRTASP